MHISRTRIANYRCFENAEISLGSGINLIIGANSTGKSAILEALMLLHQDPPSTALRHGTSSTSITVDLCDMAADEHLNHGRPSLETRSTARVSIEYFYSNSGERSLLTHGQRGLTQFSRQDLVKELNDLRPYLSVRRIGSKNLQFGPDLGHEHSDHSSLVASVDEILSSDELQPLYSAACRAVLGMVPRALFRSHEKYLGDDGDNCLDSDAVNAVRLIVDLLLAQKKSFLFEEIENELHHTSLRQLLQLVERSVARENQFVITTHSNIVLRSLGSIPGARVIQVTRLPGFKTPTSTVEPLPLDPEARIGALQDLGFNIWDLKVTDAWLIFEESSAERIVRDFLIPWFVQELQGRLRTIGAQGVNDAEAGFRDLHRLFIFVHLDQTYRPHAWVLLDGDTAGHAARQRLQKVFPTWPKDHFRCFEKKDFELYFPARFQHEVARILSLNDRGAERDAKLALLLKVIDWLKSDPSARMELKKSCAPVIAVLKEIAMELDVRPRIDYPATSPGRSD